MLLHVQAQDGDQPHDRMDRRALDPELTSVSDYLRQLQGFDHVIVRTVPMYRP